MRRGDDVTSGGTREGERGQQTGRDPVAKEEPATVDTSPGVAGSSARREHERRVAKREERIRQKHPRLGGLILAVSDDPQTTRAWATGAVGEERLGRRLDAAAGPLVRVLHDRGVPGSRANLDHLVVCPTGVFVVDASLQQAGLVREALPDEAVEVRSVLCFVEADWPLLGGEFAVRDVSVTSPRKLATTIARPGPLTEDNIHALFQRLATTFPAA